MNDAKTQDTTMIRRLMRRKEEEIEGFTTKVAVNAFLTGILVYNAVWATMQRTFAASIGADVSSAGAAFIAGTTYFLYKRQRDAIRTSLRQASKSQEKADGPDGI